MDDTIVEEKLDRVKMPDNNKYSPAEEDIKHQKEKEAKELQKTRFGYQGELFKKRQELVKPIQDKIYAAIKSFLRMEVMPLCSINQVI